jgi:hypothetical protein
MPYKYTHCLNIVSRIEYIGGECVGVGLGSGLKEDGSHWLRTSILRTSDGYKDDTKHF